jgi:hypothetical protein
LKGGLSRVFTCLSVVDSQALRKPDLEPYICLGSTLTEGPCRIKIYKKCCANIGWHRNPFSCKELGKALIVVPFFEAHDAVIS